MGLARRRQSALAARSSDRLSTPAASLPHAHRAALSARTYCSLGHELSSAPAHRSRGDLGVERRPRHLSDVIAETGADTPKEMRHVMTESKARFAGRPVDDKALSELVRRARAADPGSSAAGAVRCSPLPAFPFIVHDNAPCEEVP